MIHLRMGAIQVYLLGDGMGKSKISSAAPPTIKAVVASWRIIMRRARRASGRRK